MKKFLAITSLIAILPIGCTSTEQGAGTGAVAGGLLGGIIGHQSGETAAGAAIGVAGGAILGGAIGSAEDRRKAEGSYYIQACPNGHDVNVTGFAPGSTVRCPVCNATFPVVE
ncbi:MAG: glycine zipper domain-containing protein [Chlamydiota bacterium]|nr:glycine zipper domain-containing protein [Chlamydiota bacterium]